MRKYEDLMIVMDGDKIIWPRQPRSMEDICERELHLQETVGTFDYAYPQDWAQDVANKTGRWPRGVVWMYDKKAHIFGRPYSVTMDGWWTLRLYEISH